MKPAIARSLPPRASTPALGLAGGLVLLALGLGVHAVWSQAAAAQRLERTRALVRALDLTDLAWLTEARYARHLSQADLHAAFQDGPASLEHFPSGSLVAAPRWKTPVSGLVDDAPLP